MAIPVGKIFMAVVRYHVNLMCVYTLVSKPVFRFFRSLVIVFERHMNSEKLHAVLQHANCYQLVLPQHTASSKEGASYHRSHPLI